MVDIGVICKHHHGLSMQLRGDVIVLHGDCAGSVGASGSSPALRWGYKSEARVASRQSSLRGEFKIN